MFGAFVRTLAFSLALFPALAFAQSPMLPGFPPGVFQSRAALDAAGGAPPATTLDPANKGAAITLSGGNLTATNNAGTDASVKSTTSHSTGKLYFEVTVVAYNRALIGIGNSSATLNNFVGSDANGIAEFGTGLVFVNSGTVASGFNAFNVASTVVSVAVDIGNNAIWFRTTSGGTWNGSGTANPATNTGGLSITGSGVGAGPYFAILSPGDSSTTLTACFLPGCYTQSVPAGFGNW